MPLGPIQGDHKTTATTRRAVLLRSQKPGGDLLLEQGVKEDVAITAWFQHLPSGTAAYPGPQLEVGFVAQIQKTFADRRVLGASLQFT